LPQKRWHLYRDDNKAKVAKDQDDHREKERKKKRDKNQQEFVRKIGRLKGGRSSHAADEEADDDAIAGPAIQYDDDAPSAADAVDGGEAVGTAAGGAGGHINLFADEEIEMKKAEAKHHKYLKEVGHTNQTVSEFAALKSESLPWYLQTLPSHKRFVEHLESLPSHPQPLQHPSGIPPPPPRPSHHGKRRHSSSNSDSDSDEAGDRDRKRHKKDKKERKERKKERKRVKKEMREREREGVGSSRHSHRGRVKKHRWDDESEEDGPKLNGIELLRRERLEREKSEGAKSAALNGTSGGRRH